ncbi:helix-turn-helix domain-containing protein [Chitinophaga solisilvae]|uniref:helix-turn-helix domain-containing protein n=1 Tax=Chitinophaga solisilvae TaxID=1233460 RepID=UPI00136ACB3D|nr:helix-turn-helix domain-containing protein [Chitinophaga solisilvae]
MKKMNKIPVRQIRSAHQATDFRQRFTIRRVEDMLADGDMEQELHRHNFYYLLALQQGKGNHEIDFQPYPVDNHTIFLMRPGQVHRLILKTGSSGYIVGFRDEWQATQDALVRKAAAFPHYPLTADRFQPLQVMLAYIFREYTERQERYGDVIKAHMTAVLTMLIRTQSIQDADNSSMYLQERLEIFSSLLATHISTHKQVSDYAALMHLSVYQLNTVTSASLGKTAAACINDYIILEARRYLLATSNKINQIAYELGYEDVSYFIRFFKKHTGYSPEAYRQQFQ